MPASEMGMSQNNKQTKTNFYFRCYLTLTKENKRKYISLPYLPLYLKPGENTFFQKKSGTHFLQKVAFSNYRLPFNTDTMLNKQEDQLLHNRRFYIYRLPFNTTQFEHKN